MYISLTFIVKTKKNSILNLTENSLCAGSQGQRTRSWIGMDFETRQNNVRVELVLYLFTMIVRNIT